MIHYIAFVTSLVIAAVAAYFSIAGLVAMFSGAVVSIIVMATVLEIGKLVTATWLHIQWKVTKLAYKIYLSSAVIVLMLITSMGIFGYLSKAHLDQMLVTGNNEVEIARIDTKLKSEYTRLASLDRQLKALDDALDRYIELGYVTKGFEMRESQADDRKGISELRETINGNILELQEERVGYEKSQLGFEAELGPIKYVAALLYGEGAEKKYDEAIRIIILMLVFVFDPLAVMLLIVSTGGIVQRKEIAKQAPPIVQSDQIYNLD
jgi:hypothetical protein